MDACIRPWRPRAGHNEHRGPEYGAFVTRFDEEIAADVEAARSEASDAG